MKPYLDIAIKYFNIAKDFVVKYFNLALHYINIGLEKIFGKPRVDQAKTSFANFFAAIENKFDQKFDPEGSYFSAIKKTYKWFAYILLGGLIYLFLLSTNFLWLTGKMPTKEEVENPKMYQASQIYTYDEQIIGKSFKQNRDVIDSTQMSPWLFKALVATEDKRFYQHSGMDLQSMAGVLVGIIKGGERGGGSTISQQLAKNLYSTRGKEMRGLLYYLPIIKTIVYKSKEWLTAFLLERNFTKGEIMTMYLNQVPYGNNADGIQTAAKVYFNKKAIDLTLEEAAVLVGLQKGTTLYNPIKNPKNSLKRRNVVLQLMADAGFITEQQKVASQAKDIVLNTNFEDQKQQSSYLQEAVKDFLNEWAAENGEEINISTGGYKIYTTIDSKIQGFAEAAVLNHMKGLQKQFENQWGSQNPWRDEKGVEMPGFIDQQVRKSEGFKRWKKKFNGNEDSAWVRMRTPHSIEVFSYDGKKTMQMSGVDSINYYMRILQSGMMAMDHKTGFIKAWVGGLDFDFFKYDHVGQGKRQPGSTFKPFVYLSAIDGPLNLTPCTRRKDEPFETKWIEKGQEKVWRPQNANGRFSLSNLTLRRALALSVNAVAAKLGSEVGVRTIIEYAKKCGIKSNLDAVSSLALGSSDVSLKEMVAAYGVFANEGVYTKPILVSKITDRNGRVLFELTPKSHQAIKKESAFLLQFMMRGGVEEPGGTGRGLYSYRLFDNGGQVAGKTGTTSNYSDAWYVGFTKDLVCGVWVGGDVRSIHFRGALGEGAHSAMPIFGKFMEKVYNTPSLGYRLGPFPKPSIEIKKDYQGCASIVGPVVETDSTLLEGVEIPLDSNGEGPRGLPDINQIKPTTVKPDSSTL